MFSCKRVYTDYLIMHLNSFPCLSPVA